MEEFDRLIKALEKGNYDNIAMPLEIVPIDRILTNEIMDKIIEAFKNPKEGVKRLKK